MELSYHSTRSTKEQVSPARALLSGIAPDGGLYVTDQLGELQVDLSACAATGFPSAAVQVLSLLLPDLGTEALNNCIAGAYGDRWDTPEICPVSAFGEAYLLELYHGPTCAFKDVALQILPRLMAAARDEDTPDLMIVTATSGDTGKAALEGFCDVEHSGVCVFYPAENVSDIQRLQMVTQAGTNVAVIGIRGNFDDAQTQVKRIFSDTGLRQRLQEKNTALSSANSINIGRLAPQVAYYFSAYTDLLSRGALAPGEHVEFIVPTGNFGDVLAGYFAKMLGLPIGRLVVASNKNRILTDFLTTGIYDTRRDFYTTISPSMDILVSSNLERLLYYASNKDSELVSWCMERLAKTGCYTVPESLLKIIQKDFAAGSATDDEARSAIKGAWERYGVLIDPHTAVAVRVMEDREKHGDEREQVRVVLSTANPYKFSADVLQALGQNTSGLSGFAAMNALFELTGITPPFALSNLQQLTPRFSSICDIAEMEDFVESQCERIFS